MKVLVHVAKKFEWTEEEMVIEQLSISAPGDLRQKLGSALASLMGPTQVQPGCLSCRVFEDWQCPGEFRIEANWESEQDLTRHLQSDAYKSLLLLMELSPTSPIVAFYTVEKVRGLDLVEEARMCSR